MTMTFNTLPRLFDIQTYICVYTYIHQENFTLWFNTKKLIIQVYLLQLFRKYMVSRPRN